MAHHQGSLERRGRSGFGHFVTAIGESNCSSSESCLRDPANPYRKTDQSFLDIDVDCAKLPYLLRAYYAWKNGLPFCYVKRVSGEGGDLRFTKTANRATSRHDIIDRGGGIDAPDAIREMLGAVFSGTYRTDASENARRAVRFLFARAAARHDPPRHADLRRQRPCRHRLQGR